MNLLVRSASGLVYAGLVTLCCWLGSPWLGLLLTVFAIGAQHEANRLLPAPAWLGFLALLLALGPAIFHVHVSGYLVLLYLMLLAPFVFRESPPSTSVLTVIQLVYVPVAMFTAVSLSLMPEGGTLIFLVFLSIWGADTFAYLAGNLFGRTPLHPRVSPKKSWEGLVGGWVLTAVGLWFIVPLYHRPQEEALFYGLCLPPVAALGDLFESRLKRLAGVKDSGNLIPGHGGLLDRIDSFLFAAPVAYFYHQIFHQ